MTFRTVVADPPWSYKSPGKIGVTLDHRPNRDNTPLSEQPISSGARYGAMTCDQLRAMRVPSADDAHLYLWTTNAFVDQAFGIARAWGFRPITVLTWTKIRPDGQPSMKMGHYFRGATEHVVFGVKGSLRLRAERALPTGYLWPRESHSRKPDAFYDLVEEASPGPYLELFARRNRPGWSAWGNEVDCDVEIPV